MSIKSTPAKPLAVPRRDQADRAVLFKSPNWPRHHLFHQPADDLDAGEIALVHGAIGGLAGEGLMMEGAVGVAVEKTADLVFQLLHAGHRGLAKPPGHRLVRQPLAAFDRVHEMPLDRIAWPERYVVAALHHARAAAFAEQSLDRDGHPKIGRRLHRMQRRKESCPAGTDDQNVGIKPLHVHQIALSKNVPEIKSAKAAAAAA